MAYVGMKCIMSVMPELKTRRFHGRTTFASELPEVHGRPTSTSELPEVHVHDRGP
jgi:hypothetical protein